MVKSCNELWCDPHFSLKFAVLVLGILVNVILIHPSSFYTYYSIIVSGYHFSYLSVIAILLIACIWFETTPITEVCLLVAALIKLIVATAIYSDKKRIQYWPTEPADDPLFKKSGLYVESAENRFYILLVMNIISMVIIVVDIILRAAKK